MVELAVSHQLSYQIHYQMHDSCDELSLGIELFCWNNNNIRPGVMCLTTITFIYLKIYLRSKSWLSCLKKMTL